MYCLENKVLTFELDRNYTERELSMRINHNHFDYIKRKMFQVNLLKSSTDSFMPWWQSSATEEHKCLWLHFGYTLSTIALHQSQVSVPSGHCRHQPAYLQIFTAIFLQKFIVLKKICKRKIDSGDKTNDLLTIVLRSNLFLHSTKVQCSHFSSVFPLS